MNLKQGILILPILCGFGSPANAGLIYNAFTHAGSDPIDYEVTIDHDAVDGEFDISYKVVSTSTFTVGKLTGFFFDMGSIDVVGLPDPDASDPYTAANLGLTNESNPSGTLICGKAFGDVNSVSGSGGCNSTLNLGTTIIDGNDYGGFLFDVGLAWKVNDITSGASGSFSIADLGLDLTDWGAIGLRGQATGTGGSGSAKEFQLMSSAPNDPLNDPSGIPEPTTLALMGLGLLGFGLRRTQKV